MIKNILLCFVIVFVFSGCVSSPTKLTTLMHPDTYEELGYCKGSACSFNLLGVIPFGFGDLPERAFVNARSSKGADRLINPAISERWYFALLGTIYCTDVYGVGIKYKNQQKIIAN